MTYNLNGFSRIQNYPSHTNWRSIERQNGVVLVMTMIVLLALTILALASTSSNQLQSVMVRNSQFRLEAFNSSYAEIDAQVDLVNSRPLSEGPPDYINSVLNDRSLVVSSESEVEVTKLPLLSPTDEKYISQEVAQGYDQSCIVFGQQEGADGRKIQCHRLRIDSDVQVSNTSISSDQRQLYEYLTL